MKKPTIVCLLGLLAWNLTITILFLGYDTTKSSTSGMLSSIFSILTFNLFLVLLVFFYELDGEIWLKQMFCKHTKIIVDTKNKTAQCARCGKYHLLQSHE